jgi:WXG100 family type VII secretion target
MPKVIPEFSAQCSFGFSSKEKVRKVTGAFATQTVQMQQAASRVDDVNNEVRSLLNSLQTQVEAVHVHWVGQAASTFQALMIRYQEDAQKLATALSDISQQIRVSGQAYATQDQVANDAVRSAGSGLNV